MNLDETKAFVEQNRGKLSGSGGKTVMPMYLPMTQQGYIDKLDGKKHPIHVAKVTTRSDFVVGNIADDGRSGGLGSAYKGYFYAVISFVLTALSMGVSLYLAAVFAYATGYFWSQRMIGPAWNVTWYKGKDLYHTK